MGIALTRFRCGQMDLIFREKPTQDHGIDAEIEITKDGEATGQLISVQVKCGPSQFVEANEERIIFRFKKRHYDYWTQHSLPVIVVLVDPVAEICFWGMVTSANASKVRTQYMIEVPRSQVLNESAREQLVAIATPVISPTTYEVIEEQDQSTAFKRVVSSSIKLLPGAKPWNQHSVRQLILERTGTLRGSSYYRNEQTKSMHSHSPASEVWVYIYHSEHHKSRGAYVARALWVDPELSEDLSPLGFDGEADPTGMVIDWNEDAQNLIRLIDEKRVPKSDYLKYAFEVFGEIEPLVSRHRYLIPAQSGQADYLAFIRDAKILETLPEEPVPPHECERLGQRVEELTALLGNAVIFANRVLEDDKQTDKAGFADYLNDAYSKTIIIRYEIDLVV